MSSFEYAMVLVSIVVGRGITHILPSLGSAVHRVRGHGRLLHLDLNYLVWIGFMLGWLVLYSVNLFLGTLILVQHLLSVVDDSWQYFLSIRP